ncbi:MAG TPA: CHAD domain-containing protein [Blastocatellia bacterium]
MDKRELPRSESVEQLARRILTDLHQTIISHESGSLAGDVDSIHDMRVTIRRLRVALSNFAVCVPKENRKRLKSILENLADALGGVRDMDVMIAAMKVLPLGLYGQEPGRDKAAVSALIRRLRARRRSRLRALINYMSAEEYAGFKRESPSDWVGVNQADGKEAKSCVSAMPQPGHSHAFSEEEHGQAA